MTALTLTRSFADPQPFASPFRALLWKEWRETRRLFWGSCLIFVIIPSLLGYLYSLATGYKDALFMGIIGLAIIGLGPTAAAWSAHVICRDLTTTSGGFVLARAVSSRKMLLAKSVVAYASFVSLCLAMFVSIILLSGGSFLNEGRIRVLFFVTGVLAVLSTSLAAAVVVRRFGPATLMGLMATVIFVFIPAVLFESLTRLPADDVLVTVFLVMISLTAWVPLAVCIIDWPPDRPAISNRTISWCGAVGLLALTAVVSDHFAINTTVVATFGLDSDTTEVELLGGDGDSVIWRKLEGRNLGDLMAIHSTRIMADGSVGITRTIRPPQIHGTPNGDIWTQMRDHRGILMVRSSRDKKGVVEACRFDFDFDAIDNGFRCVQTPPEFIGWGSKWWNNIYYCPRLLSEYKWGLAAYSVEDGRLQLRSSSPSFYAEWPQIYLADGGLRVMAQLPGGDANVFQHYVVDTRDPDHIGFSQVSPPYQPHQRAGLRQYGQISTYAENAGRVALSTNTGIEILRPGEREWTELGHRRAGIVELLAGRENPVIVWKGDRLYEFTSSGLTIYDTTSDTPRRIAHSVKSLRDQICPINSRHFVIQGARGLEVHRLPD